MEGNNNRDLDLQHEAAKIANKTVGSAEIHGIPVLETEQGTMLLEVLEKLLRESRVDSLTGLYRPKAFLKKWIELFLLQKGRIETIKLW